MNNEASSVIEGTILNGRFRIEKEIGRGAAGLIYKCYDEQLKQHFALKTLLMSDPIYIHSLKKEFRSIVDASLHHPNLIKFYQLHAEKPPYFFTMELLQGDSLVDYVWQGKTFPGLNTEIEKRINNTFPQICDGVEALHQAGVLHRDIKPSNILVTSQNRAVLLDFGLATDLTSQQTRTLGVGTPKFWAPEQVIGKPVFASDWFSIGATLFYLLTGHPIPQAVFIAQGKIDWSFLIVLPDRFRNPIRSLLNADTSARGGSIVLRQALDAPQVIEPKQPAATYTRLFIGRDPQLKLLSDFICPDSSHARISHIYGQSGIGKSELVKQFLATVESEDNIILAGKCRPNEVVNFRALDSLIDSLAHQLALFPATKTLQLLPRARHAQPLLQQFPVFGLVEAFNQLNETAPIMDPAEVSKRALIGLRELLVGLADLHSVILWIDDIQWADSDSLAVLREVLKPSDASAIKLVVSYRDTAVENDFIRGIKAIQQDYNLIHQSIHLLPLDKTNRQNLTTALIDKQDPQTIEHLSRDSGGSPYLIGELVRFVNQRGVVHSNVSLHDMVKHRLNSLSSASKHLVEAVSIANHPISSYDLEAIIGVSVSDYLIQELSSLCWIKSHKQNDDDNIILLESYHDRMRETVVSLLPTKIKQQWHKSVADVLTKAQQPNAALCAEHYAGALELDKSAHFSTIAAQDAMNLFAFDQAIEHYRFACNHYGENTPHNLALNYGIALKHGGRFLESATWLEETLNKATSEADTTQLAMLVAESYLKAADTTAARRSLYSLLPKLNITTGHNKQSSLIKAFTYRVQNIVISSVQGYDVKPQQLNPNTAFDITTMFNIYISLHSIAHLEADVIATQVYRETLKRGSLQERVIVFLQEAVRQAALGGVFKKRSYKTLHQALLLNRKHDFIDYYRAYACWCLASFYYFQGKWKKATSWWARSEKLLPNIGDPWLPIYLDQLLSTPYTFQGKFAELSQRLDNGVRSGKNKGDLWALSYYDTTVAPIVLLVQNKPEQSIARMESAIKSVKSNGVTDQHIYYAIGGTRTFLYKNQPELAWSHICNIWSDLDQGGNLHLEMIAGLLRFEKIKAALALAKQIKPHDKTRFKQLLRRADKLTTLLQRSSMPHAQAFALTARASIHSFYGHFSKAKRLLIRAIDAHNCANMPLLAETCHIRLQDLDDSLASRASEAEKWLAEKGVIKPLRLVEAMTPVLMGQTSS